MTIDNLPAAIRHLTKQDPTITGIFGDKEEINRVDQDTDYPYMRIVAEMIDDGGTKDGRPGTVSKWMVTIDMYHPTLTLLKDGRKALLALLQDYEGTIGEVQIQEAWLHQQIMGEAEETDVHIYRDEYYVRVIN